MKAFSPISSESYGTTNNEITNRQHLIIEYTKHPVCLKCSVFNLTPRVCSSAVFEILKLYLSHRDRLGMVCNSPIVSALSEYSLFVYIKSVYDPF